MTMFLKPIKGADPSSPLLPSAACLFLSHGPLPHHVLRLKATGSTRNSLSFPRSNDVPQRLCLSYSDLSPPSLLLKADSLRITVGSSAW